VPGNEKKELVGLCFGGGTKRELSVLDEGVSLSYGVKNSKTDGRWAYV
jgi:hypothetical protein